MPMSPSTASGLPSEQASAQSCCPLTKMPAAAYMPFSLKPLVPSHALGSTHVMGYAFLFQKGIAVTLRDFAQGACVVDKQRVHT